MARWWKNGCPAMPKNYRADIILCDQQLAESRTRAQALIMAGLVYIGEQRINKPSDLIAPNADITIRGNDCPFVSRGGLKLAHGLAHFAINPSGWVVADVGASTGGFCDVLLQNNAKKIYAIDVGYGQLHEKIRQNPNIINLERTNARLITDEHIPEMLDFIVCDASFINLQKVLHPITNFLKPGAPLMALIKPQFQLEPKYIKKGIVRDPAAHQMAQDMVVDHFQHHGFQLRGITPSPITGAKGNVEFLLCMHKLS